MRRKKYLKKLVIGIIMGALTCGSSSVQADAGMSDVSAEMEAANQIVSDNVYNSNLVWMTKL